MAHKLDIDHSESISNYIYPLFRSCYSCGLDFILISLLWPL